MEHETLSGRFGASLRRAARRNRGRRVSGPGRVASLLVIALAGFMMASSATTSRGTDLRPNRNNDLIGLVQGRAQENRALSRQVEQLRTEVDALSGQAAADPTIASELATAGAQAGLSAVKGPAVRVTLTDAPLSVQPAGLDPDLLVVHQQDIQMVANVLWGAGAEAMTIQDQRITSITGIKCVGNTVVLRGIPYAPPYVITAIGDPDAMEAALASSDEVRIYREYVDAYHLGWSQQRLASATLPAYQGSLDLKSATAQP